VRSAREAIEGVRGNRGWDSSWGRTAAGLGAARHRVSGRGGCRWQAAFEAAAAV